MESLVTPETEEYQSERAYMSQIEHRHVLAIVLTRKAFLASWPVAYIGSLLGVGSEVTCSLRRVRTFGQGREHKGHIPRKLNRRVKVLPQPGTGQTKWASLRRRLALAI